MKLVVSQKSFANALSTASRFTSSRAQLPILGNVLLETKNNKLNISATNLEMSVLISIAAKIEGEGKITVPSKVIYDIVSALDAESVELSSEKEQVFLVSGTFSSKVSAMNASDFPLIPSSLGKDFVTLTAESVFSSLSKVIYAVSADETRPTLTGALFVFEKTGLSMVATDGFRLSKKNIPLKDIGFVSKMILPKGVLSELSRLSKEEKIAFEYKKDDKQVVFQAGDMFLSSRVIEGDFPDYEKIIPAQSGLTIDVGKGELAQGVKLASVFARDVSNVVRFVITENIFKIISESSQSGSQENAVDAKISFKDKEVFGDKKEFIIAFNCRFIEDFLNSIDGDNVEIRLNDSNSPGVFLDTEDKNLLHLIMPVRI